MTRFCKGMLFLFALFITVNGFIYLAFADHDAKKERRKYQKRERRHSGHSGEKNLPIVENPTYRENCAACHFAYQPQLLPSGSWSKILTDLSDHFGETLDLDPESQKIIAEYLKANAADCSSSKLSTRFLRSLGGQTPKRITDIPCIRKYHHEISQDVIKREPIGSLSNCVACHKNAEKGVYDDDDVKIPK
ncbi:diheme cytochrome c [Thermodesulfobacteriota bacterium]